jgi:hypothetical protein
MRRTLPRAAASSEHGIGGAVENGALDFDVCSSTECVHSKVKA